MSDWRSNAKPLLPRCATCGQEPGHCAHWLASSPPAWLDAPDGPGWWWERFPDGSTSLTRVERSGEYLYERARDGDYYPLESTSKWQRVAPPREG